MARGQFVSHHFVTEGFGNVEIADWTTSCDQKDSGSDACQWNLMLQVDDGQLLPYYPQGRKLKQKTFTVEHVARLRTSIFHHCLAILVDSKWDWWWWWWKEGWPEPGQKWPGVDQWERWSDHWPGWFHQWEPGRTLTTASSKGWILLLYILRDNLNLIQTKSNWLHL